MERKFALAVWYMVTESDDPADPIIWEWLETNGWVDEDGEWIEESE